MYIQIESLQGMTKGLAVRLKNIGLYCTEELAALTPREISQITHHLEISTAEIQALIIQAQQLTRLEDLLLGRLKQGHLVFVDTAEDPEPDWPFRVVKETQAPYPAISPI